MKLKKLILFLTIAWVGGQSFSFAAVTQWLQGHVPAVTARLGLQAAGDLPATNELRLAIGLPLRNQDKLASLLDDIYNPASPNWHQYLTVAQFTEQFGPSQGDYDSVVAFARTNGFKVVGTPTNRMLVVVNASVAQIEKTFHLRLRQYQHPSENRLFYAPDAEPSLDLATPVLHVSGLDNYQRPRPGGHAASGRDPTTPPPGTGGAAGGTGPSGSWRGKDFRNAYVPGTTLTGTGQTVGLVEFDGYYSNDIAAYATQSGLSVVPLTNVLVGGFSGAPGAGEDGVFEVSLDIEMAASMAPGLTRIMVYETSVYNLGDEMFTQMATDNQAQQISSSWWFSNNPTTAQIFQEFAMQGQSFFIASMDDDAFNAQGGNGVYPPLDFPYTITVGGTTLTTSSAGAWTSETVWNFKNGTGSGGGVSSTYTIPVWQQSINMPARGGSATMRNIPDVACVANGFYVVYSNGSTTTGGWGTSFAAPLWGGYAALANQQAAANGLARLGFLNPLIYEIGQSGYYGAAFHDVTVGNNTNSISPTAFFATNGYDLCTGWGSPTGTNLINLLAPAIRPAVLSAPKVSAGKFQFTASSMAFGKTNYLQASTNPSSLASWVSLQTNVASSNVVVFTGLSLTNAPARFYRVVQRP